MRRRTAAGTSPQRRGRLITVWPCPGKPGRGLVRLGPLAFPCALGRSGITRLKREGDGATPAGRLKLLRLMVRRHRMLGPATRLPSAAIRRSDGWCDEPRDGRYNRPVHLPFPGSHEQMWREDRLYDIVGVLDWNIRPRKAGAGSAIFLHLARPGFEPTAGCVALRPCDLRLLLSKAGAAPVFRIGRDMGRPVRHRRPALSDRTTSSRINQRGILS